MVSCQLGCGRLLLRRGGRRASWSGTQASVGYEIVQNFDVPVPQMVEVQFFAALSPVPEQVIEVPKILPHDVPPRRLCRDTPGVLSPELDARMRCHMIRHMSSAPGPHHHHHHLWLRLNGLTQVRIVYIQLADGSVDPR